MRSMISESAVIVRGPEQGLGLLPMSSHRYSSCVVPFAHLGTGMDDSLLVTTVAMLHRFSAAAGNHEAVGG